MPKKQPAVKQPAVKQPAVKQPAKRRRTKGPSTTEESAGQSGANALDIQSIVNAVLPAVTEGVVKTLVSIGVIKPSSDERTNSVEDEQVSIEAGPSTVAQEKEAYPSSSSAQDNSHNVQQLDSFVNGNASHSSSASRSLSLGIDNKIKGKIWANEFVQYESLLHDSSSKLELVQGQNGGIELKTITKNQIKSLDSWFKAFHIFVSIYLQKYPEEGPALMKYANTIQELSKRAGDAAAIQYDQQFRLLRESIGSQLSFGTIHYESYNEALAIGLCKTVRQQSQTQSFQSFQNDKKPCFAFNNGHCFRKKCMYAHNCQQCKGAHSKKQCPKKGNGNGQKQTANAKAANKPIASAK